LLLAFCSSSTLSLYILAMEVSVSPRATVCVFPLTGEGGDPPEAPPVGTDGVLSPMITPGRMCETCCSSLRICWERASIFAFCSSIFFSNGLSWTRLRRLSRFGLGVLAEAGQNNEGPKEKKV